MAATQFEKEVISKLGGLGAKQEATNSTIKGLAEEFRETSRILFAKVDNCVDKSQCSETRQICTSHIEALMNAFHRKLNGTSRPGKIYWAALGLMSTLVGGLIIAMVKIVGDK